MHKFATCKHNKNYLILTYILVCAFW